MVNVTYQNQIISKKPISGLDLLKKNQNLKNVVAIKAGNKLKDLRDVIDVSCDISFVTTDDAQANQIIRNDTNLAFVKAISNIYPNAFFGSIGFTDFGFYCDVLCVPTIKQTAFEQIEQDMKKIVKLPSRIDRKFFNIQQSIDIFQKRNQKYQANIASNMSSGDIALVEEDSLAYFYGKIHSLDLRYVKFFKILSVSGVYWDSNKDNVMMQRVYIASFCSKEHLSQYLDLRKKAQQIDHRKIGKDQDLFHFQEESQGMVFWHQKGYNIILSLQNYIRKKQKQYDYEEVQTPLLCSDTLWKKSGHIDKFGQDMFFVHNQEERFAVKPMNCPCHIEIFKKDIKSYKELPIRMSEFGRCHRNEASGGLHGLMRVRSFVQDDAHIFCTQEQVMDESLKFFDMVKEIYSDLGFDKIHIKLSLRPEIRSGDDKIWDMAEKKLEEAIKKAQIEYEILPEEGAFYGPKVEFHLTDSLKRSWQCGTLQLDNISAKKLDALYVDAAGNKQNPVILHRAVLGTFERFIGILLENYEGKLPIWLAPIQIVIATVTQASTEYAQTIYSALKFRTRIQLDSSNSTIGYKIRYWSSQKIHIVVVIGEQEVQNQMVNVRYRNTEKSYKLQDWMNQIDSIVAMP